jgi:transcriptional regulator with XRE-family HTH domain
VNVHKVFQDRLKSLLYTDRGSFTDIAARAGYSPGYLSALARGGKPNPSIGLVWTLAATLGVSPYWLLGKDD